jgi:hypothetical protein
MKKAFRGRHAAVLGLLRRFAVHAIRRDRSKQAKEDSPCVQDAFRSLQPPF